MLPELYVGLLILGVLAMDLTRIPKRLFWMGTVSAAGILLALPLLAMQGHAIPQEVLGGMYRVDALAVFFKAIFIGTAFLVLLMTRQFQATLAEGHGEFYLLILTATLGMMFAASSANFLMLFVSLELVTITFYILTAYLKTHPASLEAGIKYLILGSVASAFLLYGVAFLYGASGSIQFSAIRQVVESTTLLPAGLMLGLLLVLAGVLFKVAAVPFHLWAPDVYQGAPTPVTAFFSVGSKAVGLLVVFRLLYEIFLPQAEAWTGLVAWIAGLTILYGNLGAIPQKNIKRLLGYSSIGHAGYFLIGVAAGTSLGATAINFYLVSYLFTNLAVFLVVIAFSRQVGSDEIRDYAGLSRRSPLLAATLLVALLSLAGIPPLSGFFGKFLLLLSAFHQAHLVLGLVGLAGVIISLYYYLLIVKTMYADPPAEAAPIPIAFSIRVALYVCLAAMVGIGIFQGPWVQLAFTTVRGLF